VIHTHATTFQCPAVRQQSAQGGRGGATYTASTNDVTHTHMLPHFNAWQYDNDNEALSDEEDREVQMTLFQ